MSLIAGFLHLSTMTFGAGQFFVVCDGTMSGLYSPDASMSPPAVITKNVSTSCHLSPVGKLPELSQFENHCFVAVKNTVAKTARCSLQETT